MRVFIQRLFPKKLHKYWKKVEKKNFDKELILITDKFIYSKSYKFLSNYWHILCIDNYEKLRKYGFKTYGSNIATNYFTFKNVYEDMISYTLSDNTSDFTSSKINFSKKQNNFSSNESSSYNYLCAKLYFSLKKSNYFKYLKNLDDNSFLGFDDPYIEIDDYKISSDKLISLFDIEKIENAFGTKDNRTILEIGAGSGRTADAYLSIYPDNKYIICDVPPAIFISYNRLKVRFPNKKISYCFDSNFEKEFEKNDITFIFPDQLSFVNKKIDLVLAIDCFHEMDKKTIKFLFDRINNITNNLYFSIWEKTKVPYSKNFLGKANILDYNNGDYPIPNNWKNSFKENLIFPSNHLGLGFKIDN